MNLKPEALSELWKVALADHARLGRLSERIIERVYRSWVRRGDAVLDLGVNVGRHFFPLAECVGKEGKVFGVEAIPSLGAAVRAKINPEVHGPNVTVASCAVSDAPGTATFFEVEGAQALSGLRRRDDLQESSQVRSFETELTTVDIIASGETIRFIKIDVEGAEFNAFKGGKETLSRSRPLVAFEDGRGRSAAMYGYTNDQFHSYFEAIDYELLDIFGFVRKREMERYGGPWNYFAVPKEILSEAGPVIVQANMHEIWGELASKK